MTTKTVPVTAEWAMWGRSVQGGYGLQAHSMGVLGSDVFQQVLSRYSPGTLNSFPQVTIGWLRGSEASEGALDFIAFSIHGEQTPDVAEEQVVLTRLFCVPFGQLAAGAASYAAMYREFDEYRLPMPDPSPIAVALPASARPSGRADRLAERAAALLLTTKPVCVLGADRVGLDERLRFIDAVASSLPYGLRSRLSASTWVSSTFTRHKLRLFFSSADRHVPDPDHVLRWDEADSGPVGYQVADGYLRLLSDGVLQTAELAEYREPTGFTEADIGRMLERLPAADSAVRSSRPPAPPEPRYERTEPAGRVVPAASVSVKELLESCARGHEGNEVRLQIDTERLRRLAEEPATAQERSRIAELVRDLRLLRPDARVGERQLEKFYTALLPLAFGAPLGYLAYCRIELCTGRQDVHSMHRPLLRAIRRIGLRDEAQLLVAIALGEETLRLVLRDNAMQLADLVELLARSSLRPNHVATVCGAIARCLVGGTDDPERQALKAALREHAYLGQILPERLVGEPDLQLDMQCDLLRAMYGARLSRADVQDVFEAVDEVPPPALLAAVLRVVDQREATWVASLFAMSALATVGFSDRRVKEFARLLRSVPVAVRVGLRRLS